MPEPEIQTPAEFQFYAQQHGTRYQPYTAKRTMDQLQADLNKAHDNLKKQVGINTKLNTRLTTTQQSLRWERIWRRILTASAVGLWPITLWLLQQFLTKR
jgi:hypothetical protein